MGFCIAIKSKSDIEELDWNKETKEKLDELFDELGDNVYLLCNDKNNRNLKFHNKMKDKITNEKLQELKEKYERKNGSKSWLTIEKQFGNGSEGGNYQGSGGFKAEEVLEKELIEYKETGKISKSVSEILKISNYNNGNFELIEVNNQGKKMVRRPIRIENDEIIIANNTPQNIADIILVWQHNESENIYEEYISVKNGGLVTFCNLGIGKIFLESEIKNKNIENHEGQKMLEVLRIDTEKFCETYNTYKKGKKREHLIPDILLEDSFPVYLDLLKKMMSGGYIYFHKCGDKIECDTIDSLKNNINIEDIRIHYGGKGTSAKGVYIYIKTNQFLLIMNIRNKGGGIYPSHIMCDPRYIPV